MATRVFTRGHKTSSLEVLQKRHEDAFKRHGHRNKYLHRATPAQFDCVTMGWVGPVQNQQSCGDCWNVSATGVVTNAFIKAGLAKNDGSFVLSPQYVLDMCPGRNGGCDGDDAPTVLDIAKNGGLPTTPDYGPYTAVTGTCRYTNQKLYKIADWGFATGDQSMGIASVQEIKNALLTYGPLSSAVAADNSWDSVGSDGVIPYNPLTPNDVDHDISIVAWDDTKVIPGAPAPGAWKILNQWGADWGAKGYCWLAYGSHQIGTEAAFVAVNALPPNTPPTPPGPSSTTLTGTTAATTVSVNVPIGHGVVNIPIPALGVTVEAPAVTGKASCGPCAKASATATPTPGTIVLDILDLVLVFLPVFGIPVPSSLAGILAVIEQGLASGLTLREIIVAVITSLTPTPVGAAGAFVSRLPKSSHRL